LRRILNGLIEPLESFGPIWSFFNSVSQQLFFALALSKFARKWSQDGFGGRHFSDADPAGSWPDRSRSTSEDRRDLDLAPLMDFCSSGRRIRHELTCRYSGRGVTRPACRSYQRRCIEREITPPRPIRPDRLPIPISLTFHSTCTTRRDRYSYLASRDALEALRFCTQPEDLPGLQEEDAR